MGEVLEESWTLSEILTGSIIKIYFGVILAFAKKISVFSIYGFFFENYMHKHKVSDTNR
jgi:hypothetical protein